MPRTKGLRTWMPVIQVVALGTLLTGCASTKFATLSDGACKAFPRPAYQIKGKTRYDQKWADTVTEVGVAGCQWKRPAARPAAFDPMPVKAPTIVAAPLPESAPLVVMPPPVPPKKPSLIQRLRNLRHKV